MNDAELFRVANLAALLSWVALAVAPRRVAPWLRFAAPGALAVLYVGLITTAMQAGEGGFDTLEHVKQLFSRDRAVLAGWVHYLAFDLFVGCWEVLDAAERGISRWAVLPCLLLTFLFGPAGLLLYLTLRAVWKPRSNAAEPAPA